MRGWCAQRSSSATFGRLAAKPVLVDGSRPKLTKPLRRGFFRRTLAEAVSGCAGTEIYQSFHSEAPSLAITNNDELIHVRQDADLRVRCCYREQADLRDTSTLSASF